VRAFGRSDRCAGERVHTANDGNARRPLCRMGCRVRLQVQVAKREARQQVRRIVIPGYPGDSPWAAHLNQVRLTLNALDPTPGSSPRPTWRDNLRIAALWVVGCSVVGFLAATYNGEFGSIVYVFIGVLVGISGAITHCVLVGRDAFRRRSDTFKAIALWIGAMTLPLVWAGYGTLTSTRPIDGSYYVVFGGEIAIIALIAAVAMMLFEARWSASLAVGADRER
jgi:hypothetical protein